MEKLINTEELNRLKDLVIEGLKELRYPYLTDDKGDEVIVNVTVKVVAGHAIEVTIVDERDLKHASLIVGRGWVFEEADREDLDKLLPFSHKIDNVIIEASRNIQAARFKAGVVIRPKAKDGQAVPAFSDCLILGALPSELFDITGASLRMVRVCCFYNIDDQYQGDGGFKPYNEHKTITISDALVNWDIIESCVGVTV